MKGIDGSYKLKHESEKAGVASRMLSSGAKDLIYLVQRLYKNIFKVLNFFPKKVGYLVCLRTAPTNTNIFFADFHKTRK